MSSGLQGTCARPHPALVPLRQQASLCPTLSPALVASLFEPGPMLVIIIVILVLFGAASIPKLARALGRAKGEFRKGKAEFDQEVKAGETEAAGRTPPATEEQLRQTARNLGIEEKGKPLDEVKRLINERVGF